jgi:outer membrane lipopolysaccharide assembly protein LptE/RlpB
MNKRKTVPYLFLVLAGIAVIAAGCGYSVHRKADLPFREITIGKIENRTLEPKLQDKLHRALVQEFAKNGIAVQPGAKARISGVINNFDMVSLSEKDDITVEYRIMVDAAFTFRDEGGSVRELKKTESPFIVSFSGSRNMADLLASRDVAEERAMADIAMEVVGRLIYQ